MSIDNNEFIVAGQAGGGGKGKGNKASEAADTLKSTSYSDIVYLLGEGELQGPAIDNDILKSTYLDETPIKNPDGTLNFKDFLIDYRVGTLDQTPIQGFGRSEVGAVASETGVGVQVKKT